MQKVGVNISNDACTYAAYSYYVCDDGRTYYACDPTAASGCPVGCNDVTDYSNDKILAFLVFNEDRNAVSSGIHLSHSFHAVFKLSFCGLYHGQY